MDKGRKVWPATRAQTVSARVGNDSPDAMSRAFGLSGRVKSSSDIRSSQDTDHR